MFERPHYIPRNRRPNLSKYKYSGEDHSIISRYILTPYWNKLVTYFPINMAPNLITLTGLGFVLINFTSLLIFEPTLECAPKPTHVSKGGNWDPLFKPTTKSNYKWKSVDSSLLNQVKSIFGFASNHSCPSGLLYLSFAIGLWIYQSLDAIDGKQARRTGTSGPLGELFDHGCDALNTTLGCILVSGALNLGQSWWTVSSQIASLANFYLTTWEEYHTGTLYLSSFSGPVEGILLVIAVFLVTSFFGPGFWDQGILTVTGLNSIGFIKALHIKDLPLNECSLLFAILSLSSNTVGSYFNVVKARRGQGGSNLKTLLGLVPFILQTSVNLIWLKSQPILLKRHLIPFMIYSGLSFAYLVGLLILSHILKSPELFPFWNVLLIWSIIGMLDSNLKVLSMGYFDRPILQNSYSNSIRFIWFSVILAGLVYTYFVVDVILDVCDYCQINCLTIKKKGGHRLENKNTSYIEQDGSLAMKRTKGKKI
ncbi:hypothetical protein CROQUDRAFT_649753 [Cronartium quercuum f. sp. fusiforme G11]|uniref:Cholinephosphotransferase n=1 Tax=Cronartium quercuum f. sp. fusiforme G11 TaxID=708437 RepID=A0A9P6THC8_9BASI|nr:hypothetical protein CROQUDRAFT_649753 [Cronartium quercuum f. sp. fusiforme G11]